MRRLLLALFLGSAAALFYASLIPEDPLWFDEVFTANLTTFQTSPKDVVERVATGDAHPPLHYLYTWTCARGVGFWGQAVDGPPPGVERALRGCNLPLVAATGVAFALLLPPPQALLGTGLLLGTATYAQKAVEARMYPMLGLFLTTAVAGALLWRPWLFSASALLAFYTHYLALVFLAPLVLCVGLVGFRRARWRGLLPLSLLLLFLPWALIFLRQAGGGANAWLRPAPFLALYAYADVGGHLLVGLALLVLLLAAVWRRREEPAAWVLLAVAAFPGVWALQAALGPNTVSERYFGAFAPPFVLAALLTAPRDLLRLLAPGLFLAALLSAAAVRVDPPRFVEEYRLIAAFLGRAEAKGPIQVLGNETGRLVSLRYYHRSDSPFRLLQERDLEDLPPRFAVLFHGGSSATNLGLLALELDQRATEAGYRRVLIPPGAPVVLAYYEKEP